MVNKIKVGDKVRFYPERDNNKDWIGPGRVSTNDILILQERKGNWLTVETIYTSSKSLKVKGNIYAYPIVFFSLLNETLNYELW